MFINCMKTIAIFVLLGLAIGDFSHAKEAQNFTGFYRQQTPLCDKKLDVNPGDLPRYSGIDGCYEGKKRMGTAAKFWVIQNGSSICGYWELAANKVWSGALVGIVRNGNRNASVFYEDGHIFESDAPRYIFKKDIRGNLNVTDFDTYGFPANVTHLERMKTGAVDSEVIKKCKSDFLSPLKINDAFEMVLNDRLDPEVIQKAFGDVSEKDIYKAPSVKSITINKQVRSFRYEDVRQDNNFVPRDVLVRNLSKRPWFVKSYCYPEAENYFQYRVKNFGVPNSKYKDYSIEAMDETNEGAKVNPGATIRVLSCRGFDVEFDPDGEFSVIKYFDIIKN